jgi:hypothetical protein
MIESSGAVFLRKLHRGKEARSWEGVPEPRPGGERPGSWI